MFGEGFRHCRFSRMIVLTGVGLLAGCGIPKPTVCELERGAIWIFPGIFGGQWFLADARRGFRDAGVDRAILGHDWNRPPILGTLANLMDEKGNRLAADEVARQIKAYREAHPRAPIDLVGYSGGAGMVLMVAEALPEDIRLGNMILAHGAVSPDYDLEKVMKRLDGKLVNFHSSHDWLMLGLGTQVFGTMDRKFVASAGKDGFV
ncbi:MAG: hypothetical protein IID32_07650, partial [Planctomycetes bacterium]|nr:hypothetical protein [Planctomycetota bacterium]